MPTYKHIFFDLDHTLWDFNKNCYHTLEDLYHKHSIHKQGFSLDHFYEKYLEINNRMWDGYNKGLISKEQIRKDRFRNTYLELNANLEEIPYNLDEEFLEICPGKGFVFPHTFEILDYLKSKNYLLHIITNGFKETQSIKLSTSGLSPYFTHVIEADICGSQKPNPTIFHFALAKCATDSQHSIMIGDDLFADVLGAKNIGMDQVFINRTGQVHNEKITHEIVCLSDLFNIL